MRSIWSLIKQTAGSWNDLNASHLGAALSFYTMFSMAPLVLISIAIAGFIFGREAAQGQVIWQIQQMVGAAGAETIQNILQHTANTSTGITSTIVGIILLLFGASSVFGELRDSMNAVWGVKTPGSGLRGIVQYRLFSCVLVIAIGFVLLLSLLVSAGLAAAGKYFGAILPVPEILLQGLNLLVSFVVVTVMFAILYKVVPDVSIEWSDVWVGGAVTSLLFSVGKLLIGIYLGKASVGSAYGAAGSLVVVMVWIFYSSQILFLGAEFTRHFAERHGSRARNGVNSRKSRRTASLPITP